MGDMTDHQHGEQDLPLAPRRRDAQRNRERLLAEARIVVGEHGAEASLEEIARRSELGIATLYRHFPSRTELMRALYARAIDRLSDALGDALDDENAWHAITVYVERSAEWLIADPGLPSIIEYMGAADPAYRPGSRFDQPVTALIERAQADGELRRDVTTVDVNLAVAMLGSLSIYTQPGRNLGWRRQLGIVLDGLRTEAARSELPGPLPSVDGFCPAEHQN